MANFFIEKHFPTILDALRVHDVISLKSDPGSGKTTYIPCELLKHFDKKIIVLEPRKIAAKWAATFIAQTLNEPVGKTVGYQYRFESKLSKETRLIFFTEGTFLKYLENNPELSDVSLIILDEFHERHVQTDLAFSFLFYNKNRPKLMLMSATMDSKGLKDFYPNIFELEIKTPTHHLEIIYLEQELIKSPLENKILWAIEKVWNHDGDILVFLPGMNEINFVKTYLLKKIIDPNISILILHGMSLPSHDDLFSKEDSKRRIILASNVAESSITIPTVTNVIDTGLTREAIYNPWAGFMELKTLPTCKSSSIQRSGRANRLGPGICVRLFLEKEFDLKDDFLDPEILKADLPHVLLDIIGNNFDLRTFRFLTRPEDKKIEMSLTELKNLGAIDQQFQITPLGVNLREIPMSLRFAKAYLTGQELLKETAFIDLCHFISYHLEKNESAKRLKDLLLSKGKGNGTEFHFEIGLIAGFLDRVGRARSSDLILSNGETVKISNHLKDIYSVKTPYWLVLEISGLIKAATKIIPLEKEWLKPFFEIATQEIIDQRKKRKVIKTQFKIMNLVIEEKEDILDETLHITKEHLHDWTVDFKNTPAYVRYQLLQKTFNPNANLDIFPWDLFYDECLLESKALSDSNKKDFLEKLKTEIHQYIDPNFSLNLNELFPVSMELNDKRMVYIHYEYNKTPYIESYLQDFYGIKIHPSLANGKIPLTLNLLGPHKRVIQITSNILTFWKSSYPMIKKEMQSEYPKHFWPDDPQNAVPIFLKKK